MQDINAVSRTKRSYWLKGILIGIILVISFVILYTFRGILEGVCIYTSLILGSVTHSCGLHDYTWLMQYSVSVFWWFLLILFILPIIISIIIDKTITNEKTTKSLMVAMVFFLISLMIIFLFTYAGRSLEQKIEPKPSKFISSKCILGGSVMCISHKIHSQSVDISIRNVVGGNIRVNTIKIGDCETIYTEDINNGEDKLFKVGGSCNNGKLNEEFNGEIVLNYTNLATGITKTLYGKIGGSIG